MIFDFNSDKINKNKLQYYKNNDSVLNFHIGDIVFIKSNSNMVFTIIDIDNTYLYCDNEGDIYKFKPEFLLHYKDASLLIYDNEWIISLN